MYPRYEDIGNVMAVCVNSFRSLNSTLVSHYTGDLIHDGILIANGIAKGEKEFIWGFKNNECGTYFSACTTEMLQLAEKYCVYYFRIVITHVDLEYIPRSRGYVVQLNTIKGNPPYDSRYDYPWCLPEACNEPNRKKALNEYYSKN